VPSFTVTAAGQKVNLDGTGSAEAQYTVTNTSPDDLNGRLLTTPQDPAKPEWFSIVGEATRDFAPGAAEQARVAIKVPAGTPPATYSVRLDAVSEANPDEDFTEGPSVSFDVALPKPPEPWWKKWWWVFLIIGIVVLLGIGAAVWLLLRGNDNNTTTTAATTTTVPTVTVPAVVNLPQADAQTQLQNAGFAVRLHRAFGGISRAGLVLSQSPDGGATADQGSIVDITVGSIFVITSPIRTVPFRVGGKNGTTTTSSP
jgi:hypothetical protein